MTADSHWWFRLTHAVKHWFNLVPMDEWHELYQGQYTLRRHCIVCGRWERMR